MSLPHPSFFLPASAVSSEQQGGLSVFCTITLSLLLGLCINMNTSVQGFVHLRITAHCITQMHIKASSAFNKGLDSSFGNIHSYMDGKKQMWSLSISHTQLNVLMQLYNTTMLQSITPQKLHLNTAN